MLAHDPPSSITRESPTTDAGERSRTMKCLVATFVGVQGQRALFVAALYCLARNMQDHGNAALWMSAGSSKTEIM